MEDNFLLVPIEVKAIVVNDKTRYGQNFQRWEMNYKNLSNYVSPRPDAFSGNSAINWNNDPSANGIYLHWSLPEALRNGKRNSATGITDYPLVPNRWLIIRYSGTPDNRLAVGWVIESDYLDPDKGTSAYISPFSAELQVTNIGRKVDVSSWKESGTQNLFLTAICPGDITFAAFQPYNENVFSIHDPLTDVKDKDTLSYFIAGWYSDPSKDILANWAAPPSFKDYLNSLKWQTAGNETANLSLYHSMLCGVNWDKSGDIPISDRPTDPSKVVMAVGNTSIDALTALIEQQAADQGKGEQIDALLLKAFQYNLLPKLDEPNGKELLDQAVHKAWFGAISGGFEWAVVHNSPSDLAIPYQQGSSDDINLHPDWLADLNQAQKDFDTATRELASMQWSLYRLWVSAGKFSKLSPQQQKSLQKLDPNFTKDNFSSQLDSTKSGTLANSVYQQIQRVSQLSALVPHGTTDAELQSSIKEYATKHGLPVDYRLNRINNEFFFDANDPVVLVSGAKVKDKLAKEDPLKCRFTDQVVAGFDYNSVTIDTAAMKGGIPTVNLANIPSPIPSLLNEFFFLDPNNATLVAVKALGKSDPTTIQQIYNSMKEHKSVRGTLPELDLSTWVQPWSPLFLMWQVVFYPITHDTDGLDNWNFDGAKYNWSGKGAITSPLNFSGLIFLTPQSSFNFKARLVEFRQKHPDIDPDTLKQLEDFISQTDDWDFLSQSLEGFNQLLALRSVESNAIPSDKTLAGIIQNQNSITPMLGNTPQSSQGWPSSNFQQYRSGQFAFQRLMIIDRFGQSIEILNSSTSLQYKPIISPDMKPVKTVLPQEPYRFVEVSPRILQPARLKFEFVSSKDDSKIINYANNINPVCAWIVPNHLNKSLSCYDPDGNILGEVRVITNASGAKTVIWKKDPNSTYATIDQIKINFVHLGEFLESLINRGATAFYDFYKVIDETLLVIDPLGDRDNQNLSILIGRPLALIRSRLQLQINGQPLFDPSWQHVFTQKLPDFINYKFPVRLGDLVIRNDGLIGYFSGNDYNHFNSVNQPPKSIDSDPYIRQIKIGNFINLQFQDNSVAYVTMFVDPSASVHATTEIIPTSILTLDAHFIDPVLQNMEVTFNVGPIISGMDILKDTTNGEITDFKTVLIPVPAEKNGTWSWLSFEGKNWVSYPVKSVNLSADMSDISPVLRTGMMQLALAVKINRK